MTASELFLRHAVKHLGQYQGNLRFFCKAVTDGHVPAADDESIGPHVQLLKRHMGMSTTLEEDEYLLRFGVAVPGLMRGICPPVSVVTPERGGFSAKRLDEATAQVTRLRAAFAFARRHLDHGNSNIVNAVQELVERLQGVTPSDDAWVEMHARLPDSEAGTLAARAFACLDESEDSSELGASILTCLANFRHQGLGAQTIEVLSRDVFWPSSMYRDAPDDVARRIVDGIEGAEDVKLNHLLLALAWTRGEVAHRAFLGWRGAPPSWVGQLYVPPEDYAHNAGWALEADGRRRDLISLSCHRIKGDGPLSSRSITVPCRTQTDENCPACGGSLAWVFDFSNLPADIFSGDRTGAPRRVLCCLHCACFCPAIFSQYHSDGTATLHSATNCEKSSSSGGSPASIRELVLAPQPPFAAADPFDIDDATSLGGVPMWLQDAQYPHCPECHNVMKFLAQFDNGSMPQPEEGVYYSFFCQECRIAAVNYQQT